MDLEKLLELIDACIGSVACDGSTAGACAMALKDQVRRAVQSASDTERLLAVRSKVQELKDGTQPRSTGQRELREVETIHKTLNVVLAELDAALRQEERP